jgi:hypothetical protein
MHVPEAAALHDLPYTTCRQANKSKFNKNAGSRLNTHATSLASLLQPLATKTDIVGLTVGLAVVFNAQTNIRSDVQSIAG